MQQQYSNILVNNIQPLRTYRIVTLQNCGQHSWDFFSFFFFSNQAGSRHKDAVIGVCKKPDLVFPCINTSHPCKLLLWHFGTHKTCKTYSCSAGSLIFTYITAVTRGLGSYCREGNFCHVGHH